MLFPQNYSPSRVSPHYERRGERATHRIASAIAKKSWKWTVLNLAWTAGPVTFIALQAGHFMGFGSGAPLKNFIYFAGYTMVAAFLATLASIIHDAFYKPKVEREQHQLLDVIERLFMMLFKTRDMMLREMDEDQRRIMAAYFILGNVGATPSAIEAAVKDLTQNKVLTAAARRANVFAEHGMYARVVDIWHSMQEEMQTVRAQLEPIAPQAYERLERCLRGIRPQARDGIERSEGFIERVLLAAEENDERLMTLQDALEIITLAIELINGRRIAMLDARLKGDSELEEAQEALDEARHLYRLAVRRRNGAIRLLVEALSKDVELDMVLEATDNTTRMIQMMETGLRTLAPNQRPSYAQAYQVILRLNRHVGIRRERLLRTEAAYAKKWRAHGERLTLAMQSGDLKRAGFYIEERSVSLADKQKLRLAHRLDAIVPNDMDELEQDALKRVVMEIANELDDMIDMSQPEELIAIESSNAANFGYITPELVPTTKAGWAALAMDAIHENRRKASHRLARNLVTFYRVPLTRAMMDLFEEQFGSQRDYLESINRDIHQLTNAPAAALPGPPPRLPEWSQLFNVQP